MTKKKTPKKGNEPETDEVPEDVKPVKKGGYRKPAKGTGRAAPKPAAVVGVDLSVPDWQEQPAVRLRVAPGKKMQYGGENQPWVPEAMTFTEGNEFSVPASEAARLCSLTRFVEVVPEPVVEDDDKDEDVAEDDAE